MKIPREPAEVLALQGYNVMEYILASMSPRRSMLLREMGLEFEVCPADIDENIGIADPEKMVTELSLMKAAHVGKEFAGKDKIIIAADTVVAFNNEILGKPKDEDDAKRMLKMLSGKKHTVYTGYCCANAKTGYLSAKCAKSDVYFRDIEDDEIEEYIASGEPMDKAGAYGIQGLGGKFVTRTEGEFNTIVGLPVEALKKMLEEEF